MPITLHGASSSSTDSNANQTQNQSLITPPPFTVNPNDLIIADNNGILILPSPSSTQAEAGEAGWTWLTQVIDTAKKGKEVDEKCKEDLEAGRGGVQEVFKRWRGK